MLLYSLLGKISAVLPTPVSQHALLSWTETGNRDNFVLVISFRRHINPKARSDKSSLQVQFKFSDLLVWESPRGQRLFITGFKIFSSQVQIFQSSCKIFLQNYQFSVAGPLSIVFYAYSVTHIIVTARLWCCSGSQREIWTQLLANQNRPFKELTMARLKHDWWDQLRFFCWKIVLWLVKISQ